MRPGRPSQSISGSQPWRLDWGVRRGEPRMCVSVASFASLARCRCRVAHPLVQYYTSNTYYAAHEATNLRAKNAAARPLDTQTLLRVGWVIAAALGCRPPAQECRPPRIEHITAADCGYVVVPVSRPNPN